MYISLRESRKNGFKQWSDSHRPKYGRVRDAEEGRGIVVPGSGLTCPGITRPDLTSPGITSPGITSPGITRPGITRAGIIRPGLTSPGITRPGMTVPAHPSLLTVEKSL